MLDGADDSWVGSSFAAATGCIIRRGLTPIALWRCWRALSCGEFLLSGTHTHRKVQQLLAAYRCRRIHHHVVVRTEVRLLRLRQPVVRDLLQFLVPAADE